MTHSIRPSGGVSNRYRIRTRRVIRNRSKIRSRQGPIDTLQSLEPNRNHVSGLREISGSRLALPGGPMAYILERGGICASKTYVSHSRQPHLSDSVSTPTKVN